MYGSADFFTLCKMTSGKMRGKWGTLAGASLCFHVIMGAANHAVGGLAGIVLAPLNAGLGAILLSAMEEKEIKVGMLFSKFDEYGRYVWGVWRPALFTLLWGLLLIIPGLIASLRYSQSLYLMLDDPSLNAKEAMERSIELMKGAKLRLFGYGLLWSMAVIAVSLLTLGIGLLWLIPFISCFYAQFFLSLCQEKGVLLLSSASENAEKESPVQE